MSVDSVLICLPLHKMFPISPERIKTTLYLERYLLELDEKLSLGADRLQFVEEKIIELFSSETIDISKFHGFDDIFHQQFGISKYKEGDPEFFEWHVYCSHYPERRIMLNIFHALPFRRLPCEFKGQRIISDADGVEGYAFLPFENYSDVDFATLPEENEDVFQSKIQDEVWYDGCIMRFQEFQRKGYDIFLGG